MTENARKINKTNAEWKRELTSDQYHVTRQAGTERPFSHPLNDEKRAGIYTCICCGQPLFSADAKFDSGTGWPSFFQPVADGAVAEKEDRALFMRRTEVLCSNCDAHLGHVFPDGPKPTGQRYCMNGTALDFQPKGTDMQSS